jgi:hypothetical protein
MFKAAVQATFANVTGAVTASHTELNLLTGKTGTVWTSSNDGAASGLDADLLDGAQGALYAQYAAVGATFTDRNFSAGGAGPANSVQLGHSGTGFGEIGNNVQFTSTANVYNYASTAVASLLSFITGQLVFRTAPSGTGGTGITFTTRMTLSATAANFSNVDLQQDGASVIDIPRMVGSFARGQCRAVTGGVTLNTSDMAAGSTFSLYNDSAAAITITQGAGVTLRLAGTTTTGNRTLSARGFATIWCNSGTEAICMGNVA